MSETTPGGYWAVPVQANGAGILVLHAWWGLNKAVREICDRLSSLGYTVFAPDLYQGRVAETIEQAEELRDALNFSQAAEKTKQSVAVLRNQLDSDFPAVGIIGFSLGAFFALDLAEADPEAASAVVLFYGTRPGSYPKSSTVFQGHFGERDDFEPDEEVSGLEEALRHSGHQVSFFRYPEVGHWFFEPDRSEAYDKSAANLAWERTIDFLAESLARA